MIAVHEDIVSLLAATGIGLLVGLERERKQLRPDAVREPAGLRTFTAVALLGWVTQTMGGPLFPAAMAIGLSVILAAAYVRISRQDPGITTEVALLLVLALGALSSHNPALAAGIAVLLASLLIYRDSLHHFVRSQLTETEVRDGLILATAALVILPLVPDRFLGPYNAINLRTVWLLCVLMMGISALGHLAIRLAGARIGLIVAGFISGFASSTATVGSMGGRARQSPELTRTAVAAATMSSATTMLFTGVILGAIDVRVLLSLLPSLLAAFAAAVIYGFYFSHADGVKSDSGLLGQHVFDWRMAFGPALLIASVQFFSAVFYEWFGRPGILLTAMVSGFADVQASAAAAATLVQANKIPPQSAVLPILAALTTNTLSKAVMAVVAGGRAYAYRVIIGLLLILIALWMPWVARLA